MSGLVLERKYGLSFVGVVASLAAVSLFGVVFPTGASAAEPVVKRAVAKASTVGAVKASDFGAQAASSTDMAVSGFGDSAGYDTCGCGERKS